MTTAGALVWMIVTIVNGEARAVFGEYPTKEHCQAVVLMLEDNLPNGPWSMQCVYKVIGK